MVYSKILELLNGIPRTVDLSTNTLSVQGLQVNAATGGGAITFAAHATTSSYSITWPQAQAASSGYVLTNDGSGNLSWAAAASPLTFSDSLVNTAGNVTLVNDSASPTASQYYGTNGSSVLGYYNLPVSGINQLTGDVTAGPGTGSQAASLVATSNSTLVTLSALSLPYSQITGAPAAITALTGDATASGPGSAVLTLATVNSDTGSFGSSTSIPSFTVNAKGLITAASGNAVVAPAGTLSGTTLNSTVVSSSLTSLGVQAQALNMGSFQINDLATPSLSTDAANKGYVDAAINGLTWKGPVSAYSNTNVPLTGGATLTIDGYSVQNGDLVLLGNQTTASQNGEYTASGIGTAYTLTANGNPTAAGDAWLVLNGTTYANSAFVATAAVPAAAFVEFAGPTSLIFTAPLVLTGNTVTITQSSGSANGYLSSTDWNTFNNKQAAGNYITALTGDGTASGPGSAAFTLATVNSNTGTFASVTVNGKGLVTAAAALSGDITTSGSVSTLATVNSNVGSFTNASITVNAKGLVTAASSGSTVSTGITTTETSDVSLSATTLVALRYALSSDAGSTPGRMWKADDNTASFDLFYVIGLAYPSGSVTQGDPVTVIEQGLINVPSHGFTTLGAPLYLGSSGACTQTAPTTAGLAVVRVGVVKDANNIWVDPQVLGVN